MLQPTCGNSFKRKYCLTYSHYVGVRAGYAIRVCQQHGFTGVVRFAKYGVNPGLGKVSLAWKDNGNLRSSSVHNTWSEVVHPAFIANNVVGTLAATHLALIVG